MDKADFSRLPQCQYISSELRLLSSAMTLLAASRVKLVCGILNFDILWSLLSLARVSIAISLSLHIYRLGLRLILVRGSIFI